MNTIRKAAYTMWLEHNTSENLYEFEMWLETQKLSGKFWGG